MKSHGIEIVCLIFAAVMINLVASAAQVAMARDRAACGTVQNETYPARMINGLEVQRFGPNELIVYGGSAVDNTGCEMLNVPRSIKVQMTSIGPGGRDDVATPEDIEKLNGKLKPSQNISGRMGATYAESPLPGWYYVTLMREADKDALVTAILTRQQSSQRTDQPGSAGISEQYVFRRSLPIAFYYDSADGFRPMICYGWPQPFCLWTRTDKTERFLVAKNLTGTAFQPIDASKWLPGYGRILRVEIVLRATKGPGGAFVSTLGRNGAEFRAGYVNHKNDISVLQLDLATTSKRIFSIRTDPGVVADIYAIGFSIAQPT